MSVNFKKALKELGTTEFSRWLLDDGTFLGVNDYDDHCKVGCYCTQTWLEFIENNCVSVHYDNSCGYLWLRVNGCLTTSQRMVFQDIIENEMIRVRELYVQVYDGRQYLSEEDIRIDDEDLAKLYLSDTIAYNLAKSYEENC